MHRLLGPGLLESVYNKCMVIQLQDMGLRVESEVAVAVDEFGTVPRSEETGFGHDGREGSREERVMQGLSSCPGIKKKADGEL